MHGRPRLTAVPRPARRVAAAVPLLLLAACGSAPVSVEVAPGAADPGCAEVMVALRGGAYDELADRERRGTTSQSTAAWGDPAVLLRCGVEPLGPTTDACVDVDGVDWVLDESGERPTFTTYGRAPAVEVSFPPDDVTGSEAVLVDLSGLVSRLPQDRECL